MYDDYPTIYETTLNENFIYFIILGVIALVLIVISLIALAKIFKKANRSGISAFIPIYNIIMLLEITNSPKIYLLLFLIPGVNIVFNVFVMFSLAKFFRKSKTFGLGLAFLPFIFYPILAFGNSEYIGINLTAMSGKTAVADIPKSLQPEEKELVVHEEKDVASKNINISIGGGVYQKDYTNTLLEVDQKQAIPNVPTVDILPKTVDPSKQTFIKPIEEEPVPEPESTTMGIDFPSQITENQVEQPKVEPVLQNQNILTPNNEMITQNVITSIDNIQQKKEQTSNQETKVPDEQSLQNSEYISCPKCGAKIKRGVKACFLCGRRLD